MRSVDRGLQLIRRDEHIRLERSHTFIRPIIYRSGRIRRPRKWMQLMDEAASAFKIWARHIEVRSRRQPTLDRLFDIQIGIRFDAAGGPRRGNARGKIERSTSLKHFPANQSTLRSARFHIKKMLVHTHQAGINGVAMQVENFCSAWNLCAAAGTDRSNFLVIE